MFINVSGKQLLVCHVSHFYELGKTFKEIYLEVHGISIEEKSGNLKDDKHLIKFIYIFAEKYKYEKYTALRFRYAKITGTNL